MSEFHCLKNRAKYTNWAALGMTASIFAQALLGLIFLPMDWSRPMLGIVFRPWRLYLLVSSFVLAIALLAAIRLPESPKFLLAIGKNQECLDVLKRLYDEYEIRRPSEERVCARTFYRII